MLKNYLKIAWRNLLRNKAFSLINIFGLALGFASSLVLFLVVKNELGYDHFHKKADRIYRVTTNALDFNSNVSMAVGPVLKNDFPEIEQITQVYYQNEGLVTIGNNRYNEKQLTYADAYFFKVFDYQWIAGNPANALQDPNTVVITESIARKYFGEQNAMGKTINLDQNDLKVTGIIKDVPSNTHFPFVFVASWKTIAKYFNTNIFYSLPGGAYTYLVLPEHYPIEKLQNRIKPFIKKHWGEAIAKESNLPLQPLRSIHFDQRYINNIITPTGKETFWALAGVAIFIIITACVNFINLSTAQAIKRSKEIGVRKVLGAYRLQLIRQFLGETAVMVITSVLIALVAVIILLPLTKQYLDIKIDAVQLMQPGIILMIAGVTAFMILFAGLYPAFVQSAFTPILALKNKTNTSSAQSTILRKSLVILQFSISQVLIICTLIVAGQIDFLKNKNLGFNKEAVLTFGIPDQAKSAFLQTELSKNPAITAISFSSGAPSYNTNFTSFSCKELGLVKDDVTEVKFVDEHYMEMFGFTLLAGKAITEVSSGDSITSIVVNETFIKKLGIQDPSEAIGRYVTINGDQNLPIMGVIQDFQSESKHKKIRACLMAYMPGAFRQASVKIKPQDMRETIAGIDQLWSSTFQESLFEYEFLDDHIAKFYRQEENMYKSFQLFSAIAIFIGCLGLYGLISFIALQKTKEIGVRKVLGATVSQILFMLSKDFVSLVLISLLIASPIAYIIMHKWLQNFAYQISIEWWVFVLAGMLAVLIAVLTLSLQAIKAALANPVKSLRAE